MPIPEFDADTGCLPCEPRFHDATVEEVHQALVTNMPESQRRPQIFEAYLQHKASSTAILGGAKREQWMDGSFTTKKPEPRDMDFVTWVPAEELSQVAPEYRRALINLFTGQYTRQASLVHSFLCCIFPPGHPNKHIEGRNRAYWTKWFGQEWTVQEGVEVIEKGIVRLWVR